MKAPPREPAAGSQVSTANLMTMGSGPDRDRRGLPAHPDHARHSPPVHRTSAVLAICSTACGGARSRHDEGVRPWVHRRWFTVAAVGLSMSVLCAGMVWLTVTLARGELGIGDQLASVISAYIGLCGLAATVIGTMLTARQNRGGVTTAEGSGQTEDTRLTPVFLVHPSSDSGGARTGRAFAGPVAAAVVRPQETTVGLQLQTRDPVRSGQGHRRAAVVPRQLPGAPRVFTGRVRELAQLTEALDAQSDPSGTVVISAIGGAGGIGKTALVLHWAHQHIEQFPDGQLYVNLRGFDPSGAPLPSAVAVRGFLDALGVEPSAIPVDLDAQAALYRSLLVGTRMLIVLDNARDSAQVTPLLPGTATCAVLVTCRNRLGGLVTASGAQPLALDVLDETEARELLVRHLGLLRVAAEPEAVVELLQRCAGLPLALGIVAARAAAHSRFPLSALADELHEASERLNVLDAGELSVNLRAVFSSSYHALDPDMAGVFGLLGLAPGPDISLAAAASLTAQPVTHARALLQNLEDANLVQHYAPGRYRMHDLVRLYASDQAHRDQPPHGRYAALRRLVDFYLHTAYSGERLLYGHSVPIKLNPPISGAVVHPLETAAAAMAWFDKEHLCLLAAQQLAAEQGWDTLVWQLAWALNSFHYRRGHLRASISVWQAGLKAAEQSSEPAPLALIHRLLGHVYSRMGMHAEALDHLSRALTLAEQTGEESELIGSHYNLGWHWARQGDYERALPHATQALHLEQSLDKPGWEAETVNAVGWFQARLGNYQQARALSERALAVFRQYNHREGEADALDSLGYITHHAGQHTQAIDYYRQAITLHHELVNAYDEADTLARLGEVYADLGQHNDARHVWDEALDLYQVQHRTTDAQRAQQQMGDL